VTGVQTCALPISAWLWSTVVLVGDIGSGLVYYETGAIIIALPPRQTPHSTMSPGISF